LAIDVNLTRSIMKPPVNLPQHYREDAAFLRGSYRASRVGASCALFVGRGYIKQMFYAMPWDFWLIFLFLSIVLPWRGRERMRHFMAQPQILHRERIRLYASTILFQWMLAAIVAWRAFARGLTLSQLGLAGGRHPSIFLLTFIGATLIAVAHWMNLRRMAGSTHPAAEKLRAMAERLFPQSATETIFFTLLALTAGICEEFIFRGFLIAALFSAGLSGWAAVIVSSVMFGVAHLYQGKGGSVGTGILGVLFASIRIAYGSIFPVVLWHAVLDVVAGIAGARYFRKQATSEAERLGG
jgi:membrane protease YdiL (CAAX protease family)